MAAHVESIRWRHAMLYLLLLAAALLSVFGARRRINPPVFIASIAGMGASLGLSDLATSGMLRLYTFQPRLLVVPDRDHALGFLLADLFSVPLLYSSASALFPRQRLATVLGMSALVTGIEFVFVQAGAFVHHHWSLWYTLVLFVLRFGIAAWWLPLLEKSGYTPFFRAFLLTLTLTYSWFLWSIAVSGAMRVWAIYPGLLADPIADRVTGAFLYQGLPFFAAGGLVTAFRAKWSGRSWFVLAGVLSLYLVLLERRGLWRHAGGWYTVSEGIALTLVLAGAAYLDTWFGARLAPEVRAG